MDPDETLDAPAKDRLTGAPGDRDASDVLQGDIGEAPIKEPGDQEGTGVDLEKLKDIVPDEPELGVGDGQSLPRPR